MKNFLFYIKYYKRTGKTLLIAVGLSLLIIAIQTVLPMYAKYILDFSDKADPFVHILINLLIYAFVLGIFNYTDVLWYKSLDRLGGKVFIALRSDLISSMYYGSYKEVMKIGKEKIKNILYYDTLNIFSCICMQTMNIVTGGIILIVFLIVSYVQNITFGLLLTLIAVLSFLLSVFTRKKIAGASGKVNKKMKEDNKATNEFVDSLEVARQNNLLGYFLSKQTASINDFINTSIEADKPLVFFKNLNSHFHQWAYVLTAVVLTYFTAGNASELVFFLLILDIVMDASQKIENTIYQIIRMSPSFGNVRKLIYENHEETKKNIEGIDRLEIRNVGFSYDKKQVFDGISYEFSKGDTVLLKGSNGSGKTTFIKLISRLLIPDSGMIIVNDIDINDVKADSLYKSILYVSQDETLLNETVRDYLYEMTGHGQVEEKITQVMTDLKIDDVDGEIEDLGLSLSGGQRKKLLLGKLMLREPNASVIIIDELENAMDNETKQILKDFERTLWEERDKHIIFVVSHNGVDDLKFNKIIEI